VITNLASAGELQTGDKFVIEAGFSLAEMPTAVAGSFRLTIEGEPEVELKARQLVGWDPAEKTVNVVAYWSDNSVERITFDRCEGDTFLGSYSNTLPTGKVAAADVAFVFYDDGTADFNFTSGPREGKTLSSWTWSEETEAEQVLKSYGEFMVGGVWKSTVKERELVNGEWLLTGNTLDLAHRYQWLEEKKVLRQSGTTNGEEDAGMTFIGINPETKRCQWWFFGEKGTGWMSFTLESDGVWITRGGPLVNLEGDMVAWKGKLVRRGEDELHYEPLGWSNNGEQQEGEREVSVWTRHTQ